MAEVNPDTCLLFASTRGVLAAPATGNMGWFWADGSKTACVVCGHLSWTDIVTLLLIIGPVRIFHKQLADLM